MPAWGCRGRGCPRGSGGGKCGERLGGKGRIGRIRCVVGSGRIDLGPTGMGPTEVGPSRTGAQAGTNVLGGMDALGGTDAVGETGALEGAGG